MLWLIVFLAVAGVLAYRAVPLSTATGLLGVTVLLYGWLGESSGRFVLLLFAYLLLFVPLNVPALRQEWFSRPLLNRLLPQLPAAGAPSPGSAAPLLEGRWDWELPAEPSPPPLADLALRSEALAAALALRLRLPSLPVEAGAEQGLVAESLYAATALALHEPRLLRDGMPCIADQARAAEAWRLARAGMALDGPGLEADLGWASPDSATLAQRLMLAHPASAALAQAARESSPAARLVAFDEQLWRQLGQALSRLTQALVGAFTLGLLIPASGEDGDRRRRQLAGLAASRVAVLLDLRLALRLFTRVPPGYDRALVAAAGNLCTLHAALAWHGAAKDPAGERPVLASLVRRRLLRLDEQLRAALQELPQPFWRGLVALLLLPPGSGQRLPRHGELLAAGQALLSDAALRERLRRVLPAHPGLDELEQRMQALEALEPTLRRLRQARFEPDPVDEAARVAAAERLGLLSEGEAATLNEALAFAGRQLNAENA